MPRVRWKLIGCAVYEYLSPAVLQDGRSILIATISSAANWVSDSAITHSSIDKEATHSRKFKYLWICLRGCPF